MNNKITGTEKEKRIQEKLERETAITAEIHAPIEEAFNTFEWYRKIEIQRIVNISPAGLYARFKKLGIEKNEQGMYSASDCKTMLNAYAESSEETTMGSPDTKQEKEKEKE